ncbi:MAG: hypothetical protein ACO1N0_14890 [Fluviicola sp.]
MNKKVTSSEVAAQAAAILADKNASKIAKELAGSALSQVNSGNQTSKEMESKAAKVLQSPKYSEETKKLAGSIVSQSNKKR